MGYRKLNTCSCYGSPSGAWELVGYPFERSGHRSVNSFNSRYLSAGRMICDCFDSEEGCKSQGISNGTPSFFLIFNFAKPNT